MTTATSLALFGPGFTARRIATAAGEDYRAAASIDLVRDEVDLTRKLACPLLVLWGAHGFVHRSYDLLSVWRECADDVTGQALEAGHFVAEEAPDAVTDKLLRFCVGS